MDIMRKSLCCRSLAVGNIISDMGLLPLLHKWDMAAHPEEKSGPNSQTVVLNFLLFSNGVHIPNMPVSISTHLQCLIESQESCQCPNEGLESQKNQFRREGHQFEYDLQSFK